MSMRVREQILLVRAIHSSDDFTACGHGLEISNDVHA